MCTYNLKERIKIRATKFPTHFQINTDNKHDFTTGIVKQAAFNLTDI